MRCAFPWNKSKKNWKMNTTAAHLLILSLAGVTNPPFLLKNALKPSTVRFSQDQA